MGCATSQPVEDETMPSHKQADSEKVMLTPRAGLPDTRTTNDSLYNLIASSNSRVFDRESLHMMLDDPESESPVISAPPIGQKKSRKLSSHLSEVISEKGTLRSHVSLSLRTVNNCSVERSMNSMVLRDEEAGGQINILRQIGSGGYGKVFLGEYFGEKVAIKAIHGEATYQNRSDDQGDGQERDFSAVEDEEAREEKMAQLEWVLMGLMDSPYIVKTLKCLSTFRVLKKEETELMQKSVNHFVGCPEETRLFQWFIVMELCEKGCLWRAMHKGQFHFPAYAEGATLLSLENSSRSQKAFGSSPFSKPDAAIIRAPLPNKCLIDMWAILETLKEVVHALMYLHENDVVHGDLKAANVLLASSSRDRRGFIVKVADFGFSRILRNNVVVTNTFGTVTHMPPELLERGIYTPGTDVFSLGVLMWEVYSASGVHNDMSDAAVITQVVDSGLRPDFPDDAPERYTKLAKACWSQHMQDRPQLSEVLAELDAMQKVYCPKGDTSSHLLLTGRAPAVKKRAPSVQYIDQIKDTPLKSEKSQPIPTNPLISSVKKPATVHSQSHQNLLLAEQEEHQPKQPVWSCSLGGGLGGSSHQQAVSSPKGSRSIGLIKQSSLLGSSRVHPMPSVECK